MWNRRKEEEFTPRPATPPVASPEPPKETRPVAATPARSYESEGPRNSAVIGKSVLVRGHIVSKEDLYIDGEVEGTIEAQENRLTVGPNGKLQAGGIKAREIVVLGTIHGNVEASEKIDIRKEARLVGDIKTARIVIEDGAYFKGSIDITKPEVKKTADARTAAPSAPVAPAAPVVEPEATAAPLAATAREQKR